MTYLRVSVSFRKCQHSDDPPLPDEVKAFLWEHLGPEEGAVSLGCGREHGEEPCRRGATRHQ